MPRRIYHCNNLIEAGYIQGLMESHGIPCHLINGNLQGGAGE
ncbi:MAG: putative signal transducing protein, partial [Candidatus Porifericomitaceae bacterium WSBS_2022_MAG_OTU9]